MPRAPKSIGGAGDALEGHGGVFAGLMLSWGLVQELIESILINLISKLIHEHFTGKKRTRSYVSADSGDVTALRTTCIMP